MALTADHLKRVINRYHERLVRYREALNRLNVYPVPDGDTGTNMSLTVQSVVEAVQDASGMDAVAGAIAHGSLMGARGNSGVILSQILRGLSDTFRGSTEVGTGELVLALDRASDAAYRAVLRPVEGTILTVLRSAADAAAETGTEVGEDLGELLAGIYRRAEQELENTPELLPVLKEAGVVDAGAAGFLLLIVAFLEEVTGREVVVPEHIFDTAIRAGSEPAPDSLADLRYEVMFLLEASDEQIATLRGSWLPLGDSIVIVGGDGTYNCHIHTNAPDSAIEAGIEAGRPYRLQITDLFDQAAAEAFHGGNGGTAVEAAFSDAPVAVIPVVAGRGLAEMFKDLGAQSVVTGGQTMNPSTQDLLDAVEEVNARTVILLPNNKNIVPVAKQVDALTDKVVFVVPTMTIAAGLSAMVAYFPGENDGRHLAEAMQSAAGDVRAGELTQAVRAAGTRVGSVEEGDWIGLADGAPAVIGRDAPATLIDLLEVLVDDDAELVTLICGTQAEVATTAAARDWLESHRPSVQVEIADGGQPLYPYLIAVE